MSSSASLASWRVSALWGKRGASRLLLAPKLPGLSVLQALSDEISIKQGILATNEDSSGRENFIKCNKSDLDYIRGPSL